MPKAKAGGIEPPITGRPQRLLQTDKLAAREGIGHDGS